MNDTINNVSVTKCFSDLGCLIVSESEVDSILSPAMALAGVTDAFLCHANGHVQQPLKPYIYPKGRDQMATGGRYIAMPASLGPPVNMVGIKWISSRPANIDCGLPRASGILILNDPDTARPSVIMECAVLSARRTAGVAASAVKHLAPAGPLRIGVLGAGPIGEEAALAVLGLGVDIMELRIFDPRTERATRLTKSLSAKATVSIQTRESPELCVRGANVIIAATAGATKGYIEHRWLTTPWLMIPLSLDDCEEQVLLGADKVVVDDWLQADREEKLLHQLTKAGKFGRQDLYAEFGQIVSGQVAGREGNENVYANFMGMAAEDVAVGARVLHAIKFNIHSKGAMQ